MRDGSTKRDHYRQVGVPYEEPDVPFAGEYIWEMYWQMVAAGVETPSDVVAWSQLTGIEVSSWEYGLVVSMGLERRAEERRQERQNRG